MTDESTEIEADGADEPAFEPSDNAADADEGTVATEQLKAVFRLGARQYCAGVGDMVSIPDLPKDADSEEGRVFHIEIRTDVLMVTGDQTIIGTPSIPGAHVRLELADIRRDKRVINFKRRRRKHSSKRTKGHKGWKFDFTVKSLELPDSEIETEASASAGA